MPAPETASAGAGDANKLISTNSSGKVDTTLLPAGIGVSTVTATASESISAGDFVSIKGLLDSKIAEFTGKDGLQKQIVELSINNAVLGDGKVSPVIVVDEELPF